MSFQTLYRHYEIFVISFGLTNAPMTFMYLINRVFLIYLDSFFIAFIEYMLVYSKNEGDYIGHMRVVMQTLKKHELYVNYSKCEFLLRSVTFLRHIISSNGIEVHPMKAEVVKNCPRPLTPTDIRSIFGLVGNYRRFMDVFAFIVPPLTTLSQNSKKISGGRHAGRSFNY